MPDYDEQNENAAHQIGQYAANQEMFGQGSQNIPGGQTSDFLKWEFDHSQKLVKLQRQLNGYIIRNGQWEASNQEKQISEEGASEILSILAQYEPKDIVTSNYSQDELAFTFFEIETEISRLIYFNATKWNVKPTAIGKITGHIMSGYIIPVFKKAQDGMTATRVGESTKRIETFSQNQNQKPNVGFGGYFMNKLQGK